MSSLTDVEEYVAWQVGRQTTEFKLTNSDDVDLRTYLLHLKLEGVSQASLRRKVGSLKQFYEWAAAEDLIEDSPFAEYDFDRPILGREEIRRRIETLPSDPQERELARLRAYNELAQELNRSADIQSALDAALDTLTKVMNLETAWVYLLPEIYSHMVSVPSRTPHDFALGAACQLPPSLEQDNRFFLCEPPDCSCQSKLRQGRLTRAVNIVECTRLLDSIRAKGDNRGLLFHASTPLITSGRTLGLINVATEEWQFFTSADLQFLSTVGAQVAVALERALLYDLAESQRQRLERELEMARDVQASLLPDQLPVIPEFGLAAHWEAAREVAGDFYDVFSLADGRWVVAIADVSDKGAPAALYMAMTHSLIRTYAERAGSPAATLQAVNQAIHEHSSSTMFVTVFLALLDPATGVLSYANAGHDPPFLRRASGQIQKLVPTGPLVGVIRDPELAVEEILLSPGDILLAYTDGVTDALNVVDEEYGVARLAAVIEAPVTGPEALLNRVLLDLTSFTGDAPQPDDITLLALARS